MASRRLDRRQGFLISATVHLMLLSLLVKHVERTGPVEVGPTPPPAAEAVRRVRLLPPAFLQRLPPPPPPPPAAVQRGKDRVSIGPPSTERARVLELQRNQELTSQPAGPGGAPKAGPPSPPPPAAAQAPPTPAPRTADAAGTFGPGLTTLPRGATQPRAAAPEDRSIGRSLRELDRRLGQMGTGAVEGGVGRQMGPLFFDPQGADFTQWVNTFSREVYRNWIVPQSVLFGFRGHVDIEFVVERDGKVTDVRVIKSSGTPALDRAAVNALTGARLDPLPADYAPQRLPIAITFYYNEGQG